MLDQCRDLIDILFKHLIFNGSFGALLTKKVHVELQTGAKTVNCLAYPVPHVHQQTFKKELDHMVELGILEPYRPPSGRPLPLSSSKMMDGFNKSLTYAHLVKPINMDNTPNLSSDIC